LIKNKLREMSGKKEASW